MDKEELAAFAERLIAARQKLYPTRLALAAKAGISRTTLRHLESGRQQPTQETIEALANALDMPAAMLKGAKRIDPDHPMLKDARDEDLEIANLFHHASLDTKLRVREWLREDAHRSSGQASRAGALPFPQSGDRRRGFDRRQQDPAPADDLVRQLQELLDVRPEVRPMLEASFARLAKQITTKTTAPARPHSPITKTRKTPTRSA